MQWPCCCWSDCLAPATAAPAQLPQLSCPSSAVPIQLPQFSCPSSAASAQLLPLSCPSSAFPAQLPLEIWLGAVPLLICYKIVDLHKELHNKLPCIFRAQISLKFLALFWALVGCCFSHNFSPDSRGEFAPLLGSPGLGSLLGSLLGSRGLLFFTQFFSRF